MYKEFCETVASVIGVKPQDIAAAFMGEDHESDICHEDGSDCKPGEGYVNGSGDPEVVDPALEAFFGEGFLDFYDGLEVMPNLGNHALHYIVSGDIWPHSGGRHLSLLTEDEMKVVEAARQKFKEAQQ